MNDVEELLTRELGEVAGTAPPTHVDVLGVRRVAGRERWRRRATLVAAAAAVVLPLGMLAVGGGDGGEAEVAAYDLPQGGPLELTWTSPAPPGATVYRGGAIHLGALGLDVPGLVEVEGQGGTSVVATQRTQGDPLVWSRLLDGPAGLSLSPLGPVDDIPAVSYDGRWIAWGGPSHDGGETTRSQVVLLDTGTGQETTTEVGGLVADRPGRRGNDLAVGTIDASGRVVLFVPGGPSLLWTPGAGPVELRGLPDQAASVTLAASGLAFVAEDHVSGTPPVVWRVTDDGTATRVGPIAGTTRDVGQVSPDGEHYLTVVGDRFALARLDLDGTSTLGSPLALPHGLDWSQLGWESATDVVLARSAGRDDELLVRCSALTELCERLPPRVE